LNPVKKRLPSRKPVLAQANVTASPLPIEMRIREGDKRSGYMQVRCDLNVLAFQTDTTRVSTCIGTIPNGVSCLEFGFTDAHQSQTHHNNEGEKVRKVAEITRFNIDQYAKSDHGDLLTTLLACVGMPLDRPIAIATKEIGAMRAGARKWWDSIPLSCRLSAVGGLRETRGRKY
jgi:hypothetical protein